MYGAVLRIRTMYVPYITEPVHDVLRKLSDENGVREMGGPSCQSPLRGVIKLLQKTLLGRVTKRT